ncbi:hypothetical protein Tco_0454447 [Tanacetum coccineum]
MRFKIGGVTFSQIVNINEIDKGLLTIFHFCPVSTCMQYWDVWKSRDERLMMVLKLSKGRLFVVIVLANRGQAKDNGKPMDDLVDDTRKKVEAPLRKTSTDISKITRKLSKTGKHGHENGRVNKSRKPKPEKVKSIVDSSQS